MPVPSRQLKELIDAYRDEEWELQQHWLQPNGVDAGRGDRIPVGVRHVGQGDPPPIRSGGTGELGGDRLTALAEAGRSYALLAEGTTMTIRPAGPGDYGPVRQLHEAISPDNFTSVSSAPASVTPAGCTWRQARALWRCLGCWAMSWPGFASLELTTDPAVACLAAGILRATRDSRFGCAGRALTVTRCGSLPMVAACWTHTAICKVWASLRDRLRPTLDPAPTHRDPAPTSRFPGAVEFSPPHGFG